MPTYRCVRTCTWANRYWCQGETAVVEAGTILPEHFALEPEETSSQSEAASAKDEPKRKKAKARTKGLDDLL